MSQLLQLVIIITMDMKGIKKQNLELHHLLLLPDQLLIQMIVIIAVIVAVIVVAIVIVVIIVLLMMIRIVLKNQAHRRVHLIQVPQTHLLIHLHLHLKIFFSNSYVKKLTSNIYGSGIIILDIFNLIKRI
jgi:hypothetical protein